MDLSRPLLRYHGGKWRLAEWIIGHFPPHRVYVEPFGGAASVLLRKPRVYGEIYNDLSVDVVNLFRVLRDPAAAPALLRSLAATPFAREEFVAPVPPAADPVERARRLIVRSMMGFGSDGHNAKVKTGFRANSNRSGTTPAHDWARYPPALAAIVERLAGVVIENRPAVDVMRQHDSIETLHYVDPPYMPETRSQKSRRGKLRYHAYDHELTVEDHAALLDALDGLCGMVVLSGYPAQIYDDRLAHWRRTETTTLADGARERTEVLWINPAASAALDAAQAVPDIFAALGA